LPRTFSSSSRSDGGVVIHRHDNNAHNSSNGSSSDSGMDGSNMDPETQLYVLKRNMGRAYADRDFEEAMRHAVELEDQVLVSCNRKMMFRDHCWCDGVLALRW
jgi:hypothetical protein